MESCTSESFPVNIKTENVDDLSTVNSDAFYDASTCADYVECDIFETPSSSGACSNLKYEDHSDGISFGGDESPRGDQTFMTELFSQESVQIKSEPYEHFMFVGVNEKQENTEPFDGLDFENRPSDSSDQYDLDYVPSEFYRNSSQGSCSTVQPAVESSSGNIAAGETKQEFHLNADSIKQEEIGLNFYSRSRNFQTQVRAHVCDICHKLFPYKSIYLKHKFLVHQIGEPVESEAKKRFYLNPESIKKDEIGLNFFSRASNMQIHVRAHACDICHKLFPYKSNVVKHKLNVHQKIKLQNSCNICKKTFTYKRCLNAHRKAHMDQVIFKCKLCFKFVDSNGMYNTELPTSISGVKSSVCYSCKRSSSQEKTLSPSNSTKQKVEKTLSPSSEIQGKTIFSCCKCQLTFTSKQSELKHTCHQQTSGGEYNCDVCNKRFSRVAALNSHKRFHEL